MAHETTLERPLPQNLDAERSVLGAILLDNHSLNNALEKLKPEDFFQNMHQIIFTQMIELGERQQAIDLVTLADQLHRRGQLEAAGGAAYLAQLVDGVPRVGHMEHYARIIKEKSLLRHLIHATHEIQQTAMEADEDPDAILDRAESSIFQLAEDRVRVGLVPMKDVVRDNIERLERTITEGKRITGLATGYAQLDNLTSGLQPSELIILAARPSAGKTAMALNIAENTALHGRAQVAIFSLEMSKESLLMRLLSSMGRVDAHKFRTGHLSREDWKQMTVTLAQLSDAPLWIDDSGSATVTEIGAKARRLKRDRGLDMVMVDYLQLIAGRGRFSNRNEEVSSITRGLKGLAKELQVPVVVLSQLTRANEREERAPHLSDLRESGAIEQDADVVIFLHRPNLFKKRDEVTDEERAQTDVIIAKQRNGPVDRVPFVFLGKYTRFEEAAVGSWGSEQDS
jgi:replicative DNA helicase